MSYLSNRRQIKRQIVKMNTPWIDKLKDFLFMWFLVICTIAILVLVIRGHMNGAW